METGKTSGPAQVLPFGLEGLQSIVTLVFKATLGWGFGKDGVSRPMTL